MTRLESIGGEVTPSGGRVPHVPSGGLCTPLGVAIKIPIVCVVLEGGPGTLHVSTVLRGVSLLMKEGLA